MVFELIKPYPSGVFAFKKMLDQKIPVRHVLLGLSWNDLFSGSVPANHSTVIDGRVTFSGKVAFWESIRHLVKRSALLRMTADAYLGLKSHSRIVDPENKAWDKKAS